MTAYVPAQFAYYAHQQVSHCTVSGVKFLTSADHCVCNDTQILAFFALVAADLHVAVVEDQMK